MAAINPRVLAALAPGGTLRAAINFGNPVLAQRARPDAEPRGVTVELARALGGRLGVPVELVAYDAAAKVCEAADAWAWDVAFLAIDPARAGKVAFTAPYVTLEGTYLVRETSPLRALADFDRPGVRIAVGRGAAYDLYLSRTLQHAQIVRADTSSGAIDRFVREQLDCSAGVRQPLTAYAQANPGYRVIADSFNAIEQAMGTPRQRSEGLDYLGEFIAEMRANGLVARALSASA